MKIVTPTDPCAHDSCLTDGPCLPDSHPRALRVQPGGNVHRGQLLEEQLGRVRDVDLRDLGLVLARPALEGILLQVAKMKVSSHVLCP